MLQKAGIIGPSIRECDAKILGNKLTRGVQVGGEKVALKRVRIIIPAGHDLSGLTFVIRSADSTAWWRDGEHCASCCGVPCNSNTS